MWQRKYYYNENPNTPLERGFNFKIRAKFKGNVEIILSESQNADNQNN